MRSAMWVLGLLACSGDEGETSSPDGAIADAAGAQAAAEAIVGGTAAGGEEVSEDGFDLWEVEVTLGNGAELEVLVFAADGALFEVKDPAGPFDYTLDPLPGQLDYTEAQTVAFSEVAGEQQLWEVKFDTDRYFYEFYVLEVGDQLWEIKLWADTGEVFLVEATDAID